MDKIQFKINIKAPAAVVYQKMIGRDTYKQWTAAFHPTSDYEGGWNKGDKIYFTGIDEQGKKGGMVAEIAENIPNKFISIHHLGILDGTTEITEGPLVEGWGDALENYNFSEHNGTTTLTVEASTNEEYKDYFNDAWPKALALLKKMCESPA